MPTANKDIELVVQITTYKENAKPRWWIHPNKKSCFHKNMRDYYPILSVSNGIINTIS